MRIRDTLFALLAAFLPATAALSAENLTEVQQAVAAGRAVLVDVREPDEWSTGHLKAAILVPLSQLQKSAKAPATLPNDKPLYLYCRSGRRSAVAAGILKKQGYDARSLSAGFDQLMKHGLARAAKE